MKNWNQLFIRQGFNLKEMGENQFDCSKESEVNLKFLRECLLKLDVEFTLVRNVLTIGTGPVIESDWLRAVDFQDRGHFGDWFTPESEAPKIHELDTYLSGLVRQFNRLGLYTIGSCDGHGNRNPYLLFRPGVDMEKVEMIFRAISTRRYRIRNRNVTFLCNRYDLLDIAEGIQKIEKEWLNHNEEFMRKQLFFHELERVLSINGESGNEGEIRDYVVQVLTPFVDHIAVDQSGNILAQKKYGSGNGPCILLNAHLDTYESFVPGRKIVKDNGVWSSSEGILGADDRAGVAIILQMARNLQQSHFRGTVKFIFTVKEEVGLVGASQVHEYFLWDVDAALVLDRRGSGDIVVSCGRHERFCDQNYGNFIEETAMEAGLTGWKCTAGGSSDTRIWASHGIQCVNLSVGYAHEHTSSETLDIESCYGTVLLVDRYFERYRELIRVLGRRDYTSDTVRIMKKAQ
ncbi:M20/M25/M40 family metallo-hydrolase [Bacillus sp. DTU_2020_1000418_1_SI_GHA_SEK_038]|uniref:M20/M25/M40 family metallo-hydrolase n=1 Tax=Bacillus sp. DTU_2020_1000418_1_SI_GHA_SEK_038 TaxID=3077585 RepID=UPI0028F0BAB3|nr:M20/M25/M40 family metallo-hydrolase [Bacillus sp. DTU_2020_1000418_1_SI_GHA_SEK_038]WNS73657.1 M20/M25/M40 family metallo-hydrolase [Bacillus sp. DTU_2020_1000418_1_SI_GHA_SEK_038]